MSLPIQPFSRSTTAPQSRRRGRSVFSLIREHGAHGMIVAVVFMSLGVSPLIFLVWWNCWRLSPLSITDGGVAVVKSGQFTRNAESEKPGETALVYITCQVARAGQLQDLLQFGDEAAQKSGEVMPSYVRHEVVYVRPAKRANWPFVLLGAPPVSAWLPAGEYEVMVVYDASRGASNSDSGRQRPFPLATERVVQDLPAGQRTVLHVPLTHHEDSFDNSLNVQAVGNTADSQSSLAEQRKLLDAAERITSVYTPSGALLNLPEPVIHHHADHRGCEENLSDLVECRREWTADQLYALRNWLPAEAIAARQHVEQIAQSIEWQSYFRGWFWYAGAGIAGLVFARWGTIAKLTKFRSRPELIDSLNLLAGVFVLAVTVWIAVSTVSDWHGIAAFRFW